VTTNSAWLVGLYREIGATRYADRVAPEIAAQAGDFPVAQRGAWLDL
jgi:hypothetical protein